MKHLTITVGIPAFNEEQNIKSLIKSLLDQKNENFILEKIIVCSDSSTDNTDKIINKIEDPRVTLLTNFKQSGQSFSQNRIINQTKSDALVLLNADILIKDKDFLYKITKPIANKSADLTSVSVSELKPENLLEKILETSMKFKKSIFENYNKGNNILTCHGRARALSKKLYKKMIFKQSVGEDAYSYLYATKNKMTYKFVKETTVYYRLPQTMSDHEKQSIRFYNSQEIFNKEFGSSFVNSQYFITPGLLITSLIKYFFINPLIIIYFLIAIYLKVKSYFKTGPADIWQASITSKNLRSLK